ncbi:MAG: metal-dependent phosphohydrolase [Streptosporangiales bacterium]|nr:metal-dependent phosphohydrolase [Streptosporangiales bacterium]
MGRVWAVSLGRVEIDLRAAWRSTAGDTPAARAVGAELRARWAEPHRRYHTTTHLTAVLAAVDELAADADDPDAVRLAAWFHDAVYDGIPGRDEERSAQLATARLPRLGLPPHRVHTVARLVRLTAGHDPQPGDADGAVLTDADLAVLGGTPEAYAAYANAIRAEYAHVPDAAFRTGRAAILDRFLTAQALFRTERGRTLWEARARTNIRKELRRLRPTS